MQKLANTFNMRIVIFKGIEWLCEHFNIRILYNYTVIEYIKLMGRDSTFYDQQFHESRWNPNDQGDFEPNLVFVGMAFDGKGMGTTYDIIKEECKKLGLKTVKIDENFGSGFVIREIKDLIEKAEFIIFDLTYERPNVYYELGYAHGAGNEAHDILLIAQESTNLHFNIAPLRAQYYSSNEMLRRILNSNLNEMIRVTRC